MARFVAIVRKAIDRHLRYPWRARLLSLEGTTILSIRIRPDGLVESVAVQKSAGHRVLDRAAVRAAQSLRDLPPPPGHDTLTILVPVRFRLLQSRR